MASTVKPLNQLHLRQTAVAVYCREKGLYRSRHDTAYPHQHASTVALPRPPLRNIPMTFPVFQPVFRSGAGPGWRHLKRAVTGAANDAGNGRVLIDCKVFQCTQQAFRESHLDVSQVAGPVWMISVRVRVVIRSPPPRLFRGRRLRWRFRR